MSVGLDRIDHQLIPKIHSLCGHSAPTGSARQEKAGRGVAARRSPIPAKQRVSPAVTPAIVAIGTSTGGPNALTQIIPSLPADFPIPIVVVQHMPPLFTGLLAERLNAHSHLNVYEAAARMEVEVGSVYLAPGDYHMTLRRHGTKVLFGLNQNPPENWCRPAVDVLFRSVVETFGARTLGVILTGMGHDGLRGCELIRAGGGQTVVQDETSSVVWGMPGSVAKAGLADRILPLAQIAQEIKRRVKDKPADSKPAVFGGEHPRVSF